jgi:zinc protease
MNVTTTELFSRPTHELTLQNGLKVIVCEDHRTVDAFLRLTYKVSPDDESLEQHGIREAVLEAKNEFNYSDQPVNIDGFQHANDIMSFPSEHLETMFKVLSSFISFVPQEEMFRRHLECWKAVNQPELFPRAITIGFNPELEKLAAKGRRHYTAPASAATDIEPTLEQLQSWHQNWCGPNNLLLVATGNVSIGEVERLAELYLGEIARHGTPYRCSSVLTTPELGYRQTTGACKDISEPMMQVIFNIPSLATTKDHQSVRALDIMSNLLSTSAPARLTAIEKNLSKILAQLLRFPRSDGILAIAFHHSWEPLEIEFQFWRIIEEIKRSPFSTDEIELAIKSHSASLQRVFDDPRTLATYISALMGVDSSLQRLELELTQYQKTTPDEVQKAAINYLTRERASVAHILPMNGDLA